MTCSECFFHEIRRRRARERRQRLRDRLPARLCVASIGKAVFGAVLAVTLIKPGLTTTLALSVIAGAATCWGLQLVQAAMAQPAPRDDELFVNSSFG